MTTPTAVATPVAVVSRWSHSRIGRRVGGALLLTAGLAGAVVTLGGLAHRGRQAPWGELLASPLVLPTIAAVVVLGYVCQSVAVGLLLPGRIPLRTRLLLPWASAAVNRVTPASAGELWLDTKVFRCRNVSLGGAAWTLSAMRLAHTLAGFAIALVAVAVDSRNLAGGRLPFSESAWLVPLIGALLVAVACAVRRVRTRLRALLRHGRAEVRLRALPPVLLLHIGARLAPVVVLYTVLSGLNHGLPFTTVVVVVVLAGAGGSTVPLPGGGGGVELAMVGLLSVSGVPFGAASAAVLAARVLGFWLPAVLGLPALLALWGELSADRAEQAANTESKPVRPQGAEGADPRTAPTPALVYARA
ncbi:MAG TPA: lysylphosphatidylglycerol synthase domain-containing protein [Mycobacteriales bacterium]|nr:lysylphosphatidylglycerol synthase domain-containing protein [Mycobacteriales bacterium]